MSAKKKTATKAKSEPKIKEKQTVEEVAVEETPIPNVEEVVEEIMIDPIPEEVIEEETVAERVEKPKPDTFVQIRNLFGTLQQNQQGAIYNPNAKAKLKQNVNELSALLTTYLNELNA